MLSFLSRVARSARIPNPFFKLSDGTLAPDKMMENIPGAILVVISCIVAVGVPYLAFALSGGSAKIAVVFAMPIFHPLDHLFISLSASQRKLCSI